MTLNRSIFGTLISLPVLFSGVGNLQASNVFTPTTVKTGSHVMMLASHDDLIDVSVNNRNDFQITVTVRYENLNGEWVRRRYIVAPNESRSLPVKTRNKYVVLSAKGTYNSYSWERREWDMTVGAVNFNPYYR
jgi:hypothetical protein